jgi:hypothetical protein
MTSSATDADTRAWLADHDYGGLDPDHVLVAESIAVACTAGRGLPPPPILAIAAKGKPAGVRCARFDWRAAAFVEWPPAPPPPPSPIASLASRMNNSPLPPAGPGGWNGRRLKSGSSRSLSSMEALSDAGS